MDSKSVALDSTAPNIEPAPAQKLSALRTWRELISSAQSRDLFAAQLSKTAGPKWHVGWQHGRLEVRRQIVSVLAGSARNSVGGRTQGSPMVLCDGETIAADATLDTPDLIDDLAYLMAKIAKALDWHRPVVHGSERFRQRFCTYSLHETDLYTWAVETARYFREHPLEGIDLESVAEELEDLGKSEARALESHLRVLLGHLLKWQYQPSGRGKSWKLTIENQRDEIAGLVDESPGLNQKLPAIYQTAYTKARRDAAAETTLDVEALPIQSPWDFTRVMDRAFWPEA